MTGIGPRLVEQRRASWEAWYGPVARAARGVGAVAQPGVGGLRPRLRRRHRLRGAAGIDAPAERRAPRAWRPASRLSAYIGATVGEIGFLRGIWMDGSQRLAWLEDYAAALDGHRRPAGARAASTDGIRFEDVSFAYPGTDRLVLAGRVASSCPAGAVVAVVGENGAGKTTLVKLLAKLYEPTSGRILVDGVDLARVPADGWRARLAGAFQDFFRFELPRQAQRRPRRRAALRRRAGGARGGGPGRRRRRHRALRRRARHAARAHLARRRGGELRAVAEAGAGPRVHARRAARPRARRAHRRPRRRDRARPLRALRRRRAPRRRAAAASRSSCRTASAPCAWPTSSSCSTAPGSSRSARTPS